MDKFSWEGKISEFYPVLSGVRTQYTNENASSKSGKELDESVQIAIISTMEAKYSLHYSAMGKGEFGIAFSIQQLLDSLPEEYEIKPFLDLIVKDGVTAERYYPLEMHRKRHEKMKVQGKIPLFHIDNIRSIEFNTVAALETLKNEIKLGPVVCSIRIYSDYESSSEDEVYLGKGSPVAFSDDVSNPAHKDQLSHAVSIVGFAYKDGELILRYQESSGPACFEKGYRWLSLSVVDELWAFDVGRESEKCCD